MKRSPNRLPEEALLAIGNPYLRKDLVDTTPGEPPYRSGMCVVRDSLFSEQYYLLMFLVPRPESCTIAEPFEIAWGWYTVAVGL